MKSFAENDFKVCCTYFGPFLLKGIMCRIETVVIGCRSVISNTESVLLMTTTGSCREVKQTKHKTTKNVKQTSANRAKCVWMPYHMVWLQNERSEAEQIRTVSHLPGPADRAQKFRFGCTTAVTVIRLRKLPFWLVLAFRSHLLPTILIINYDRNGRKQV